MELVAVALHFLEEAADAAEVVVALLDPAPDLLRQVPVRHVDVHLAAPGGAQQRLLSVGLALQLVRSELGPDADGAARLLEEAQTELGSAIEELRDLAQGIHPAVLTEHGLAPALRTLAARSAVPVELRRLPAERLPASVEAAAYFVVSEALANVAKHAHASGAVVTVDVEGGALVVEVADDGVGGVVVGTGSGLAGMSDRVQALGGELVVQSRAGRGTRLCAEIPCGAPIEA